MIDVFWMGMLHVYKPNAQPTHVVAKYATVICISCVRGLLSAAHCKASMFGSSVSIPISNGRLNLGTWQVRTHPAVAMSALHGGQHRDTESRSQPSTAYLIQQQLATTLIRLCLGIGLQR
jgi:hypothetical protein